MQPLTQISATTVSHANNNSQFSRQRDADSHTSQLPTSSARDNLEPIDARPNSNTSRSGQPRYEVHSQQRHTAEASSGRPPPPGDVPLFPTEGQPSRAEYQKVFEVLEADIAANLENTDTVQNAASMLVSLRTQARIACIEALRESRILVEEDDGALAKFLNRQLDIELAWHSHMGPFGDLEEPMTAETNGVTSAALSVITAASPAFLKYYCAANIAAVSSLPGAGIAAAVASAVAAALPTAGVAAASAVASAAAPVVFPLFIANSVIGATFIAGEAVIRLKKPKPAEAARQVTLWARHSFVLSQDGTRLQKLVSLDDLRTTDLLQGCPWITNRVLKNLSETLKSVFLQQTSAAGNLEETQVNFEELLHIFFTKI